MQLHIICFVLFKNSSQSRASYCRLQILLIRGGKLKQHLVLWKLGPDCFPNPASGLCHPIRSFQVIPVVSRQWSSFKVWLKNNLLKNHLRSFLKMQFSASSPGLTESESLGMDPEIFILVFPCVWSSLRTTVISSLLENQSFPLKPRRILLTGKPLSALPNFLSTILLYSRSSKRVSTSLFSLPIVVKLGIKDFTDFSLVGQVQM